MRKAIETLKNIWKIEDLRQRILITILFVAIYRFGSYVVLPGINPAMLTQLHQHSILTLTRNRKMHLFLHWELCLISLLQSLFSCWGLRFRISRNFNVKVRVVEEK